MNIEELKAQINVVVGVRQRTQIAVVEKADAYQKWVEANQELIDNESNAKNACQEAESRLREMTVQSYSETGDKSILPGIGIRVMTRLAYDNQLAMEWAMEHKLALKLDATTFEKIAKTSSLPFVTISEEPQATIATDLQELP